ncbi:8-oxo-dGTPase [Salsuginibacillus halophilus]|uniref:8-oxo-dGTPase n=1 Tax=Salsuginibacillus halophilus TaxID=517424 RepID=A0A2P8HE53_9BACI|nr:nucleoside triphosphatase YtkD [Salsuginibacillus halophilus]PSL44492.1 8-oxo-dGTPase [Salsuginibacillus halophilus]
MNVHTFKDYYANQVRLSFMRDPFSAVPGHVWVICRYQGRWLLTVHPRRGLEFPGGKVERNEPAEAAAVREVWEETGGKVAELLYIGQYEVRGRADTVVKNVYFAEVDVLVEKNDYMETEGPLLLDELPKVLQKQKNYSFIMKDEVLPLSLKEIRKRQQKKRK